MKNNKFLNKNNSGRLMMALIAIGASVGITIYQMNDYLFSPVDARTETFTSQIEVQADGDVRFQESRLRYINYGAIEQSLYFTADDEDVSSAIHRPVFDTTSFANSVYDPTGQLLIEGDGTAPVEINSGWDQLYLTYSWLSGAVNELGDPFRAEDNESINLLHYNSQLWGRARFDYDYTIKGVALEYADTAEFYWTVAATDDMKTSNVSIEITLPGTNYGTSDVAAYAFGANKVKVTSVAKDDSGHVVVNLTAARLYPGEFIVTRVNFPASALTIPDNTYGNIADTITHLPNVARYQNTYEATRVVYRAIEAAAFVFAGLALIVTLVVVWGIYRKYDKEHESMFYGEYYRELPAEYGPALMGYLYRFKETTKDDVSATLMDLIRRGYIEVDAGTASLTDKKANYTLILRKEKDLSDLPDHERQLIRWFFEIVASGDTLTLKQLEDYTKTEARAMKYMAANKEFNIAVLREAGKCDFYDDVRKAKDNGRPLTRLLTIGAVVLIALRMLTLGTYTMILGGILLGAMFILTGYFASIERRSVKGHEDYVRWRAFEKFLKEFSNIKDYPLPGIVIWEHYMVYATSFGIADLVEKQLRYKYKELGRERELQSSYFFRYPGLHYYYWMGINRSFIRAQQTIQVAQAQRNNSARGGGGRFGGGGGISFGGGGSGVRLR